MSQNISPQLLFDKSFCKIYFYDDIKAVHLDWGRFATSIEFIEACECSLQILISKRANKIIADNSKVAVVSIDNQNWLTKEWFPRALKEGFKYSAVIANDDFYVNYAVKRIEKNIINSEFVINYFTKFDDAKMWLSTLP